MGHVAGRRRRAVAAIVGSVLVVGCAASQPTARPADFPFHGTDGPYRLHWRLDREQWSVRAVGLVETTRSEPIQDVVIELRGLDKSGRVISRAFARSYREEFTAQLRTRGDEDRFDVVMVNPPAERGGN